MSWFIDVHSEYQRGLDFKRVKRLGYSAAIIKATQGTGYIPSGLKDFVGRARNAGLLIGLYHFLDDSGGDRQAAHFVSKVKDLGGAEGKLLVVDFEQHPNPAQTATNRALEAFVSGVKRRTNNHAVVLYSGYGFWTGGDPSGNARDYGVDAIWDARYPDMARHKYPRAYYRSVKGWYDRQARWGGMQPAAWQFTSAGRVAGQYIDCDRFFGTKDDLLKLTTRTR